MVSINVGVGVCIVEAAHELLLHLLLVVFERLEGVERVRGQLVRASQVGRV